MLETIREFAAGQLDELPSADAVGDAHARWYTALAERAAPHFHARQGREWLDRLEAEHANLRAAGEHLVASGDRPAGLRLVAALWLYWAIRGHWTEGRQSIATTLADGVDGDPLHLIEALWGAAILAMWQGESDEGERCALRLLEIAEQHGLRRGEAIGFQVLGIVAYDRGDLDKARRLYEDSLRVARTVDDAWLLSVATNNLGGLHSREGDYARAAELFEESLAIGEAHGDLERRARQLDNLAWVRYKLGDNGEALDLYRRALVAAVEIGVPGTQSQALFGIAMCEADAGNVVVAARLLGSRDALTSSLGAVDDELIERERDRTLEVIAAVLGPDQLAAEFATGAGLSVKETLELALGENDLPT